MEEERSKKRRGGVDDVVFEGVEPRVPRSMMAGGDEDDGEGKLRALIPGRFESMTVHPWFASIVGADEARNFFRMGVHGDGSCFFHSLAAILNYDDYMTKGKEARQRTGHQFRCSMQSEFKKERYDVMKSHFPHNIVEPYDTSRRGLCESRTWANEVTILFSSLLWGIKLVFVDAEAQGKFQCRMDTGDREVAFIGDKLSSPPAILKVAGGGASVKGGVAISPSRIKTSSLILNPKERSKTKRRSRTSVKGGDEDDDENYSLNSPKTTVVAMILWVNHDHFEPILYLVPPNESRYDSREAVSKERVRSIFYPKRDDDIIRKVSNLWRAQCGTGFIKINHV